MAFLLLVQIVCQNAVTSQYSILQYKDYFCEDFHASAFQIKKSLVFTRRFPHGCFLDLLSAG